MMDTHFILEILQDMDFCNISMAGKVPLSYLDIKAYLDLMGIDLGPFYVKLIRNLSKIYTIYINNDDKDEPHPITKEIMGGMTAEKLRAIKNL